MTLESIRPNSIRREPSVAWRSWLRIPDEYRTAGARFVTRLADEYLRSRATRVFV